MGHFLEFLRDRLVHRSQIGKRKLDAAFVRRELDRKLRDLGEAVSALAQAGRMAVPEELAAVMAEVTRLEKDLETMEAEIAVLQKENAVES